jgi:phosphotransferase system enzyme I (PtsP)
LLTELRRIVESMAEANTLEQALQALVSQTRLAMTVDCCSVYVAEPDMRRYRLAATDGLAESAVGRPPCRSSRVSSAWWVSVKS